jgi:hypothetical protein
MAAGRGEGEDVVEDEIAFGARFDARWGRDLSKRAWVDGERRSACFLFKRARFAAGGGIIS